MKEEFLCTLEGETDKGIKIEISCTITKQKYAEYAVKKLLKKLVEYEQTLVKEKVKP